jgi:phosphate transport system substrate-binding protein
MPKTSRRASCRTQNDPVTALDRPRWLWALALVVLVGVALQVGRLARDRATWPQPPPPEVAVPARLEPGVVRLAGTGSAVLPVRRLVEVCAPLLPDLRIVVEDSIGSTGGVRAVQDGAIDVGLVSRRLRQDETGVTLRPFARVPVVMVAHPSIPSLDLAADQVAALFSGANPKWPDGREVVVIQRERGDSSLAAVHAWRPDLKRADEAAWAQGRWRVIHEDRALERAVLATPGAIAWHDLPSLRAQDLPLSVMAVDGVDPGSPAWVAARYPLHKDLAFAVREPVRPEVLRVLACLVAPERGPLLRAIGALPLAGVAP